MTALGQQNTPEFVWFVSRWLVAAMAGPDGAPQLDTKRDHNDKDRAVATRRSNLIDANCTKEVA